MCRVCRPGYPDFVQDFGPNGTVTEQSWTLYITETQKTIARLHAVDTQLLQGLLSQHFVSEVPSGVVANLSAGESMVELTLCSIQQQIEALVVVHVCARCFDHGARFCADE